MAATAPGVATGNYQKHMSEAIKRFSRSIELCDDYLRGYYGLKLVSVAFSDKLVVAADGCFRLPRGFSVMVPRQQSKPAMASLPHPTWARLSD